MRYITGQKRYNKDFTTYAKRKLKYIRQRLKDYEFVPRIDIERTPLKEEIERIFLKGNIDDDCDKIARMLRPYEEKVQTLMDGDNFKDAFTLFYEILESLSYHFVNDEHYCHFDDMYSPDFICDTMMTMIINRIEKARVPEDVLKTLSDAMSKIEKMEAYTDYCCPFAVQTWNRFIGTEVHKTDTALIRVGKYL